MTRSLQIIVAALAMASFLAGCGNAALDKARREDTPEAWRDFIRENRTHAASEAAIARLAELEFERARRLHTTLAYKRFLDEFPGSARQRDAMVLLEGLRFEAASAAGTAAAWADFLRDHPDGVHAAQAREKLEAAEFAEAMATDSVEVLRAFAARHPNSKHRLEAEKRADELHFAEAKGGGPRALLKYLETSAAGAHRDDARAALLKREVMARVAIGAFDEARRGAEHVRDEGERAELKRQIDRAELEWISAALDPGVLEAFAKRHPGELGAEARARARALARDRRASRLKLLGQRLSPHHYARPEAELIGVLDAPDPRDRWLAATELGRIGSMAAFDALLQACAVARFSLVRHRAFEALQTIVALLPQDTLDIELRQRIEALRKMAQGPDLHIKVAVLEELLGDDREALKDYARALRIDDRDPFVLTRIAEIRVRLGEGYSAAVAAREVANSVLALLKQRAEEQADLSPVLLARTLCGAHRDAAFAVELIDRLPASAREDFPDDLTQFGQRAVEAERLASARLSDAEAAARIADTGFKGCRDDGQVIARLADGEADRLAVVEELRKLDDPKVRPALELAARRDPSNQVREAARAALGPRTADAKGN